MLEDIQIQFQGFRPSRWSEISIKDAIYDLYCEAPANSFLRATVSRVGDSFEGAIQISSQAGEFFARASGRMFTDVRRKLIGRMRRQLKSWKKTRFSDDGVDYGKLLA